MTAPNVEERLSAAAFRILTDDMPHSLQAQRWATGYLRFAARGRATAFQRRIQTARVRAFRGAQ